MVQGSLGDGTKIITIENRMYCTINQSSARVFSYNDDCTQKGSERLGFTQAARWSSVLQQCGSELARILTSGYSKSGSFQLTVPLRCFDHLLRMSWSRILCLEWKIYLTSCLCSLEAVRWWILGLYMIRCCMSIDMSTSGFAWSK